ncbi:MAG TPA: UDP-glucose/GDP-mannose dehydrogenase family protein [Casimicrobiaceae bacterium]|nr:UDP-glucose/GDP-mannose dehydrogenase family protein [Casimicrobiaceae bacterium]
MKITMIGTGYVGLVSGACLAEVGNDVLCLDVDAGKIAMLEAGGVPIHEPGLEAMIQRNVEAGRLRFTTDVDAAVGHGSMQFIAVGTPPGDDGSADMRHVLAAATDIGRRMRDYKIVVDKSTVPVGTADRVRGAIAAALTARKADIPFAVVSNPEFLKEGAAVDDFMRPDRIVIGSDDERAIAKMRAVYAPFQRNRDRLLVMDARSAELTKYAANAMLATRISFMNEMANLADALGADIEHVRQGIGADPRIGYHFLYAGAGYGGSCFPKDVRALSHTSAQHGRPLRILAAVAEVNEAQKLRLLEKIVDRLGGELGGRTFALWGLAFKPDTDDMREAPSRALIAGLLSRGAVVVAYDPVAVAEARRVFADTARLSFASSPLAAVDGADALVVVTEWKEFRSPDLAELKRRLRQPLLFDGRNLFDPGQVRSAGLEYFGIGRR